MDNTIKNIIMNMGDISVISKSQVYGKIDINFEIFNIEYICRIRRGVRNHTPRLIDGMIKRGIRLNKISDLWEIDGDNYIFEKVAKGTNIKLVMNSGEYEDKFKKQVIKNLANEIRKIHRLEFLDTYTDVNYYNEIKGSPKGYIHGNLQGEYIIVDSVGDITISNSHSVGIGSIYSDLKDLHNNFIRSYGMWEEFLDEYTKNMPDAIKTNIRKFIRTDLDRIKEEFLQLNELEGYTITDVIYDNKSRVRSILSRLDEEYECVRYVSYSDNTLRDIKQLVESDVNFPPVVNYWVRGKFAYILHRKIEGTPLVELVTSSEYSKEYKIGLAKKLAIEVYKISRIKSDYDANIISSSIELQEITEHGMRNELEGICNDLMDNGEHMGYVNMGINFNNIYVDRKSDIIIGRIYGFDIRYKDLNIMTIKYQVFIDNNGKRIEEIYNEFEKAYLSMFKEGNNKPLRYNDELEKYYKMTTGQE